MHLIKSLDGTIPSNYVPPLIGNGSLCLLVDYTGAQIQKEYFDYGPYFGALVPMIWWAGRRYDDPLRKLIPFGHFETLVKINGVDTKQIQRTSWEQELNVDGGFAKTTLTYRRARDLTVSFVPFNQNLIVLHKEIEVVDDVPANLQLTLHYVLHETGKEDELPHRMTINPRWNPELGALEVFYKVDGVREYEGFVALFSDVKVDAEMLDNKFKLHANFRGEAEVTFYLLFMDNENPNYLEETIKLIRTIKREGYSKILKKHAADWSEFWSRSYVNLPDKDLADVWRTCLYHIRCSTTRWSIPVGVLETHWWGKYFHDELFPYTALVSSNHVELAERVPMFRLKTLNRALRVTGGKGARYSWESTEDGDEGCPPSPTLYEIHHIATIALECWIHYLYTHDLKFLRKVYPVIKECAEYLRLWHVYEIDKDKAIIGACTDLDESIFPVRKPFYTCCGATCAFSIASKASQLLGVDEKLRSVWKKLAEKLLDNLPFDGEKYVPFDGANHQSLGVLGVIFPFSVLDPEDERVRKTVFDYMGRCRSTMGWRPTSRSEKDAFFVGEGEGWIWNSAWLATCLARMGEGRLTYDVLKKIVSATDAFGSVSEAKTAERTIHHWFTTGAGAYVYALNEALIQSTLDEVRILPAASPGWSNLSFKLLCQGKLTVETRIVNGKLRELNMVSPVETSRKILIPGGLVSKKYKALGGEFVFLGLKNKKALFQAHFRRALTVKFEADS